MDGQVKMYALSEVALSDIAEALRNSKGGKANMAMGYIRAARQNGPLAAPSKEERNIQKGDKR